MEKGISIIGLGKLGAPMAALGARGMRVIGAAKQESGAEGVAQ